MFYKGDASAGCHEKLRIVVLNKPGFWVAAHLLGGLGTFDAKIT